MKIYKISQSQETFDFYNNVKGTSPDSLGWDKHDYFEAYDENLIDLIGSFVHGESLSWNPVDINRLKPIYTHFVKRNFLDDRDIKNLHKVIIDIGQNIARLDATTDLSGHGVVSLSDLFERAGYSEYLEEIGEDEAYEKLSNFLEWEGQTALSDYGLPNLKNYLFKIMNSNDPVNQLVLLNQLLDVVHQRNDLAAFLVRGGSESLMDLSTLEI